VAKPERRRKVSVSTQPAPLRKLNSSFAEAHPGRQGLGAIVDATMAYGPRAGAALSFMVDRLERNLPVTTTGLARFAAIRVKTAGQLVRGPWMKWAKHVTKGSQGKVIHETHPLIAEEFEAGLPETGERSGKVEEVAEQVVE
jgi:hypothetical protein